MSGPNQIEISKVGKIDDIRKYRGRSHVGTVKLITTALGFGDEARARLVRQTLERSAKIFGENEIFSGKLLAVISRELGLKPDTFLGTRNFDREQTGVNGSGWCGPPQILTKGDAKLGQDLMLVISRSNQRQVLAKHKVDTETAKAIEAGKVPVSVDLIRELVFRLGEVESVTAMYDDDVGETYRRVYEGCYLRVPDSAKSISQAHLPPLAQQVSDETRRLLEEKYGSQAPAKMVGIASSVFLESQPLKPTTEDGMPGYNKAFAEDRIGRSINSLASKVARKGVYLNLNGRKATEAELSTIMSGSMIVSPDDLAAFLDEIDQKAAMGQAQEVVDIDEFLARFKKSANTDSTSNGVDVGHDEGEVGNKLQVSTTSVPSAGSESEVDADSGSSSETEEDVVWNGESVTIRGQTFSFEPKHPDRKVAFGTLSAIRDQLSLSWSELAMRAGMTEGMLTTLRYGTTFINQERAELWSRSLSITVPQLFGIDPLPALRPEESEVEEVVNEVNDSVEEETPAISDEEPKDEKDPSEDVSSEASGDGSSDEVSIEVLAETASQAAVSDVESSADEVETSSLVATETAEKEIDTMAQSGAHTPNPDQKALVFKLLDDILPHVEGVSEVAQKALGFLAKLARGESVTIDEAYPAWRKRQAAQEALRALREADSDEYQRLLAEVCKQ